MIMDFSIGPDPVEVRLNNLLVGLRETVNQAEALSEALADKNLAHICRQLADICEEQAEKLEQEIQKMGSLPKSEDPDRATLEEWITRLEGRLSKSQLHLFNKAKSIAEDVQMQIQAASEEVTSESVRSVLQETRMRIGLLQEFLDSYTMRPGA